MVRTLLILFLACSLSVSAQIDTVFWFAVPEAAGAHADKPIYLRMSADNQPSYVTISCPARNLIIANNILVNSGVSTTVDLTPWVDSLENSIPNKIRDYGLLIKASKPITAYYDLAPTVNTEIVTLKGRNGLGKKFITPFQTRFNNSSGFSGQCWSSVDVVASEDNTTVTITPYTDVVGHKKNIPYNIVLNRGQIYSCRDSLRTKTTGNMSGTLVVSDKPIAVTLRDDGIDVPALPQGGTDFAGDQLMSFENVGKQYVAIRGEYANRDYLYVVGTANGTNLTVNGVASVINERQTVEFSITSNIFISADQPVYVYHLTGSQNESGSAILPSIECNGSSSISYTRPNGNKAVLLIAVPTVGVGNFTLNGNAAAIPASAFTPVPNSPAWSAAKIDLTGIMTIGSNTVKNSRSLFHMALVTGDNGSGGSAYGYFSNYKAEISAGPDSTICQGNQFLLKDPGVYYNFQYSVFSGDMSSLTPPITAKPKVTTTYVLERLGQCYNTDTITVFIDSLKADAGNDTIVCKTKVKVGGNPPAKDGVAPYTYSWSTGATTDSALVDTGKFYLTVKDKLGCIVKDSIHVQLNPKIALSPGFIQPRCKGLLDGKAYVKPISGGTPPFSYKWTGNITTDTLTTGAGTVKVVVTDTRGCKDSVNINITQPVRLDIDTVVTAASCPNVANGKVVASATGGTTPYQFNYDPNAYQSGGTFNGVAKGTYLFHVKDVRGCLDSALVTVKSGPALIVDAPKDTTTCPGNMLSLSGSSTTPGLTYTWDNGITDGVPFQVNSTVTYHLTGTNASGCAGTDSTKVSLAAVPNAKINTAPSVICSDTSQVQLSGVTAGGTWSGPGMNTSTGMFNPTTAGAGSHWIFYTVGTGCTSKDSIQLTVSQRADATIKPAGPFCASSPAVQLQTNTPGGNWAGAGVNSSGMFDPSVAGNGNHTIVYSLGGTCPKTGSRVVIVNTFLDAEIIKTGPYCASDDTVLLQSKTPGATWTGPGITDGQQGVFDPRIAGPGTYTITHKINSPCGSEDQEQITVLPLDTTHIQLPNDSICYNSSPMTLSADKPGGTWSGTATPSGTFDPATRAPGKYRVFYTYSAGCPYTDSTDITIPDTIKLSCPDSTVSCFNLIDGSLVTTVTKGSAPFTYNWSDSPVVHTANRTNIAPGNYTVTVIDAIGCTAYAYPIVHQPSQLVFSAPLAINDSCFQAKKGAVDFAASGGTPNNGKYTYTINPVAGVLNTTGDGYRQLGAMSYTATVKDLKGCSATQNFTITEPQKLVVVADGQTDYCGQKIGSVSMTSTNGGTQPYSYQWTGGPAGTSYSNLGKGIYTLTVTDDLKCTSSDTAKVDSIPAPAMTVTTGPVTCYAGSDGSLSTAVVGGTGILQYSWSDGNNVNQPSRNNFPIGTYWVEVKDAVNCKTKVNFTITQPQQFKATNPGPKLMCYGVPVTGTFQSTGGNIGQKSFYLNLVPNSANYNINQIGTYNLHAKDNKGCYSDTVTFVVSSNPDIKASLSSDVSLCRFDTATFTASATLGNGNYQYSWDYGAGSSLTQVSYPTSAATPNPKVVTLIVSDGCSKSDTVQRNINIHEDPTASISFTPSGGCYPFTANFTLTTNLNVYNFTNGESSMGGGSNLSYTYQSPGIYFPAISGTTSKGCKLSYVSPIPVQVFDYPEADFYFNPEEPTTVNNSVKLMNTTTGGSDYQWFITDSSSTDTIFKSDVAQPTAVLPEESGYYEATLIADNSHGCLDTVRHTVFLKDEVILYIPTAFTPNQDGYNEVFRPVFTSKVDQYQMWIYNRWGEPVYYSQDPEEGWNGEFKGLGCKPDIYTIRVIYHIDKVAGIQEYTGKLNLMK